MSTTEILGVLGVQKKSQKSQEYDANSRSTMRISKIPGEYNPPFSPCLENL
jgi:hypothetical protein